MDQKEQDIKQIQKALAPTKVELISLPLVSLFALLVFAAITHFQDVDGSSYQIVADNIESHIRHLLSFVDKYLGVTFLTLIFWMLIGTVVYSLIWIGISTYSAYRSDIPDTKGFVFPRGYKKSKIIHEAIAKIAMRTAASIFLLLWTYLVLTTIIPMSIRLFYSANRDIFSMIGLSLAAILIMSFSIFVIFILSRLALLRTRILFP